MSEHVPLAEKVGAEVDAFTTLWQKRRWLAIILILTLAGVGIWSITSNWIKVREISRLQTEKDKVETTLREMERENRGLRETVAPLLARAAKEFPGEEINISLKKLLSRLEADLPSNRPLASASVTVDIIVESPDQVSSHFMDRGGFLAFGKGSEAVLTASSVDSFGHTIQTNQVRYRAILQMSPDDKMVGKPLREITQSEYLQIEIGSAGENQKIIGGKVIVVFNGSIRAEFEIPSQKANGRRIFVRNIQTTLRSLFP